MLVLLMNMGNVPLTSLVQGQLDADSQTTSDAKLKETNALGDLISDLSENDAENSPYGISSIEIKAKIESLFDIWLKFVKILITSFSVGLPITSELSFDNSITVGDMGYEDIVCELCGVTLKQNISVPKTDHTYAPKVPNRLAKMKVIQSILASAQFHKWIITQQRFLIKIKITIAVVIGVILP